MLLPRAGSVLRHLGDVAFRRFVGGVVITEFPKSGATWIGSMLSDVSGLPYVREGMPPTRTYLIHKHALPGVLSGPKPIVVHRDGRDALVSLYFHAYFLKDQRTERLSRYFAEHLPLAKGESAAVNMYRFVERSFVKPIYPRFTWSEFANAWFERSETLNVRYEEAKHQPAVMLQKMVDRVGGNPSPDAIRDVIERHSFEKISGRKTGNAVPNAFLRKGIVGDWKNHFSKETAELFDHYAGDQLIELGYERDRSWISECCDHSD